MARLWCSVARARVRGDEDRDGPVDDFQGDEDADGGVVVGELVQARQLHSAQEWQVDGARVSRRDAAC
jgi:hypothetical protein